MKTVTALRADRPGRVAGALDGARWRTLPREAGVKARLSQGVVLDRERAPPLARERRRLLALETAIGALRRHDRSVAELGARLAARGVPPAERERALETLGRAGLVDDERVARTRATVLAERGSGDALIRHDLEQRGLPAQAIEAALAALEPELDRAVAVVARRGVSVRTARLLAARGFGEDAVEVAVAWKGDAGVG
jgi:regulatory protein